MTKIRVGVSSSVLCVNEIEGLKLNVWATGGVRIMGIPYKKYKAPCSPTSALGFEKE